MNAPQTPRPSIDAFHRDRSKCIDAFAAVEEALIKTIIAAGLKTGGESFGQKLALLRKAKPNAAISAERLAKLQTLLDSCVTVSELRNDIVHSALKLATIGDDQRACFINLRHCTSGSQTARLFTLEGLRALTTELSGLASAIHRI